MDHLKLNDKSQTLELTNELLFELNTSIHVLTDLLVKVMAKGDEGAEDKISTIIGESFSSFRTVYLEELSERFDIVPPTRESA